MEMVGDAVVTGVFAGQLAGPRGCRWEEADTHFCVLHGFWKRQEQMSSYSVLKASPCSSALPV